eukprot:548698-Rhodomonas_salina.1
MAMQSSEGSVGSVGRQVLASVVEVLASRASKSILAAQLAGDVYAQLPEAKAYIKEHGGWKRWSVMHGGRVQWVQAPDGNPGGDQLILSAPGGLRPQSFPTHVESGSVAAGARDANAYESELCGSMVKLTGKVTKLVVDFNRIKSLTCGFMESSPGESDVYIPFSVIEEQ